MLKALEIGFKNKKLKKLCLTSKEADKTLGFSCARKLRTRLAEIDAAQNVEELIAGRPHPLIGDRLGEFSLDLAGGYRLVFRPERQPPPIKEDGGIDWSNVENVIVVFIGDYHE
ncbi:MAG: killer suppression protein HigA [Candidatus Thiodiazotropha lotti]